MIKKNLNEKVILKAAIELVQEKGYDNFSMRELAQRLDCKAASLYNHISGLDEINAMLSIYVSYRIKAVLLSAVEGLNEDDAFIAAATAYRDFALSNYEFYKIFIGSPSLHNGEVRNAAIESFSPIKKVIDCYKLSEGDCLNFIRALRSFMHGFIELSANGFMQSPEYSKDRSYEMILKQYLLILRLRGKGVSL